MEISVLIAIVGVLVALTNIIVEVVKKSTWDKLPTNVLALIVAEALTLAAGFAYFQIKTLPIAWYGVVALVVVGFRVAYAAKFGFDKMKGIINWGVSDDDC